MQKKDVITNWTAKIPKAMYDQIKPDKNFKNHLILPESMIIVVGSTGSGKSNWLVEFLSRKTDSFYEIIIFTSIIDDPLYKLIKSKIPDAQIIDKVSDLPSLADYKEEDRIERLLVFDDTNTLTTKEKLKMTAFFEGGRKKGFTVVSLAQDYITVPKFIREQAKYIVLFHINDETKVGTIYRKYPMGIKKDLWLKIYHYCTKDQGQFMTINLNTNSLKQNFIGKI